MSGLHENDSSDRLFDVPFVGEEKHSAGFSPIFVSCSSGKPQVGGLGRQSSQSSQAETVSLRNEGLNESGSTSSEAVHTSNCNQRIEKGTSKWQLKGKRNSRHINKNRKQNLRKSMPDLPFRNFYSNSCLYDVNLEVKANYRPQHVPLVSLMSKLNGKAIVGHPLTVEVLDDLSDLLLSDSEYDPTTMSKRDEERKPVVDKLKGPAIACIPLKLVFSRLNEAVNSSARPAHHALTPSDP
ncbi:unnamed protein product, partial [Vitis vinifera]